MKQLKLSSHAAYQKPAHHSPCCFARPVPNTEETAGKTMGFTPVIKEQYRSTVIAAAAAVADTSSSATKRLLPGDFFVVGAASIGTRRRGDNSCSSSFS